MSSQSSLPLLSWRARPYEPNERFVREQSERRLTALTGILGVILLVVGQALILNAPTTDSSGG